MNDNKAMTHSKVLWKVTRTNGSVWEAEGENLRTNSGINWQAEVLGNQWGNLTLTGSSPIQIAITEDTGAPAASNTSIDGELAADGMSRETATYSHTADASSYTQTAEWQYTGGSTITVAKAGMCSTLTQFETVISLDTHFLITAVSPVAVLNSNDTLEIQWGVFY